MASVRPKKYITMYRWRLPVAVLGRAIIVVLLVASLILPWIQVKVILPETTLKQNAAEGTMEFLAYPLGILVNFTSIVTYDYQGNPARISSANIMFSSILALFGVLVVILLIINALLMLYESDWTVSFVQAIKIRISPRLYSILEAVNGLFSVFILFLFAFEENSLVIGDRSLYQIKIGLMNAAYLLKEEYYHTQVPIFAFQWGPGYVLFLLIASALFAFWLDKYLFVNKWDLSVAWRLRGHMIILSLIYGILPIAEAMIGETYHIWSLILHIIILEQTTIIEPNPGIMIWAYILIILELVIFVLGAKYLPSKYLMQATPFITLSLPDDELTRRHKMLPTVTRWYRMVDWSLVILALVLLGYQYVIFVRGLGALALDLRENGGSVAYRKDSAWCLVWSYTVWKTTVFGYLWTQFSAVLIVLFAFIEALLILKPTR